MANTTVNGAKAIHGQNPQVGKIRWVVCPYLMLHISISLKLLSEIVFMKLNIGRSTVSHWLVNVIILCREFRCKRISSSSAASLIDKAIEIKYIGGVYGNQRPTEFLCLLLKLLQIQPDKEILIEYLQADEFKYACYAFYDKHYWYIYRYLRALSAMYVRMTFRAAEVYEILEPLLKDYKKLRVRNMGIALLKSFSESHD